jgi:hypothetical protein
MDDVILHLLELTIIILHHETHYIYVHYINDDKHFALII